MIINKYTVQTVLKQDAVGIKKWSFPKYSFNIPSKSCANHRCQPSLDSENSQNNCASSTGDILPTFCNFSAALFQPCYTDMIHLIPVRS